LAAWLKQFLVAPQYPDDPELSVQSRLFNFAALAILVGLSVALVNNLLAARGGLQIVIPASMVAVGLLLTGARRGYLRLSVALLPLVLLFLTTAELLARDGVRDSAVATLAGVLALAATLMKRGTLAAFTAATVAVFYAVGYGEISGALSTRLSPFTDWRYLSGVCISFVLIAAGVRVLMDNVVASLRRAHEKGAEARRAQNRAELAMQASRASLWEWDIGSGTMHFDKDWTETLGFDSVGNETSIQRLREVIHPEDLDAIVAAQLKCLKGDTPDYAQEARVRNRAGDWVWILGQGRVIERGPDGRALRMAGMVLDVTERKNAEYRLRQSEERFEKVFRASPGAIAIARLSDGRYFDVNEAWVEIFGYSRDEVIGRSSLDLGIWVDPPERSRFAEEIRRGGALRDFEVRFRKKSGATIHALASAEVIDIGGEPHVIVPILDITDRKRAEELLNHIARGVSSQTGEAFFREVVLCLCRELPADMAFVGEVVSPGDRIRTIACCRDGELSENFDYPLAGSPCTGVLDRRGTLIYPERAAELFPEDAGLAKRAIEGYVGTSLIDAAGKAVGILVVLTRKPIERKEFFVSLLEIFASRAAAEVERSRAEERVRQLATRDPLTGLPNRLLFNDRLNLSMNQARRNNSTLAVFFIDLDRFKYINDSLGHAVGDAFLKAVAERLSGVVRKGDTLARLGGDEFVVLLENVKALEDEAGQVARKILASFSDPFSVAGHTLSCSCSIGISVFPSDATDPQTLLRDADTAMYHVKEGERGSYQYFSAEMNERMQERLHLENGLRDAIAGREFTVMYQPKVAVEDGRITGLEALLRWRHPSWGLVPPARFISVAEDTGLILDIGRWVLAEVCRQIRDWRGHGLRVHPVAVNLSVRQFTPALIGEISKLLKDFDVDPGLIELEITESLFLRNSEDIGATLKGLAQVGTRVVIDDFGAGYSSLSYIRNFAVSGLKIDRSFVSDIVGSPESVAIVRAIITMARGLGIRVIAEGVETQDQLDLLRDHHCDEYQGFLFCGPLAAEEIERRYLDIAGARFPADRIA
jgi:diguanylate cyclase (GGDEF)-like protein/PAS domain S-box-containing protein